MVKKGAAAQFGLGERAALNLNPNLLWVSRNSTLHYYHVAKA
jgi:hypothetical protein